MLSRTAANLFWIGRYMERAETVARLLEVGSRNALIPNIGGGYRNEWDAVLQAAGKVDAFRAKYGETVQRNIESFLFFDMDNPSSVASCVEAARENGRIVRTALTGQVWDALNTGYQEMRELRRTERSKLALADLVDWTKRHSAMVRGAIDDTLLRNDGYCFLYLGYALERGDSTARMVDVKYYVLLPEVSYVGSGIDNYQWSTLLRSMSAERSFNYAYGGEVTPGKIVDFLVLNREFPRALITASEEAMEHLDRLARGYGRTTPAQTQARALYGELCEMTVGDVFEEGLHEFLTRIINENASLSATINDVYLSGETR
ncbi:MAG: alpha-E domain-containing protein [Pseudomonadota bacterium]